MKEKLRLEERLQERLRKERLRLEERLEEQKRVQPWEECQPLPLSPVPVDLGVIPDAPEKFERKRKKETFDELCTKLEWGSITLPKFEGPHLLLPF